MPIKFSVQVVKGENLKACDVNGKSDPYVTVRFGDVTKRTHVIKKNLNPYWGETLNLKSLCEEEVATHLKQKTSIEISCWDSDSFSKDDFMGVVSTSFPDILMRIAQDPKSGGYVIGGVFVLRGRPNKNDQIDSGRLWIQFHVKADDNARFEKLRRLSTTLGRAPRAATKKDSDGLITQVVHVREQPEEMHALALDKEEVKKLRRRSIKRGSADPSPIEISVTGAGDSSANDTKGDMKAPSSPSQKSGSRRHKRRSWLFTKAPLTSETDPAREKVPILMRTQIKKIISEEEWQALRSVWVKFAGSVEDDLPLEQLELRALIGSIVVSDQKDALGPNLDENVTKLLNNMAEDQSHFLEDRVNDVVSFISGCFDVNKDGLVSWQEFASAVSILMKGTSEQRMRAAFFALDTDKDGMLSLDELKVFALKARRLHDPFWGVDNREVVAELTKTLDSIYAEIAGKENQPISYELYATYISTHPHHSSILAPPDIFFT